MDNPKRKLNWKFIGKLGLSLLVIATLILSGLQFTLERQNNIPKVVIKVGNIEAYTGTPDYVGTTDVQVQQALDALPATGGEVQLISPVYTFSATVSRAINNVTISGMNGTTVNYDAAHALFSVGVQTGWIFRDLRMDAGGITDVGSRAYLEYVSIGGVLQASKLPTGSNYSGNLTGDVTGSISGGTVAGTSVTDSGLTAGQAVYAGTGGLLSSEAGYEYNAGTNTLSVPTLSSTTLNAPTGRGATYKIAAYNDTETTAQWDYKMPNASADVGAVITTQIAAGNTNILLSPGNFSFSPFALSVDGTVIKGSGKFLTILTLANSSNATAIEVTARGVELADFTLDGNASNQSAGTWNGIAGNYVGEGGVVDDFEEATWHDLWIQNCKNAGIAFESGTFITSNTLENIVCQSNYIGFDISRAYGMGMINCVARLSNYTGLFCNVGQDLFITGCAFDDAIGDTASTGFGARLYNVKNLYFVNCEFNNNYNAGLLLSANLGYLKEIYFTSCKILNNSGKSVNTVPNVYINVNGNNVQNGIYFSNCALGSSQGESPSTNISFQAPAAGGYQTSNVCFTNCQLPGTNDYSGLKYPRFIANTDYIAPGEIRTISGTISTLTQDAFNSVDNPFGQAVRVLNLQIHVSTAATATSPNIDCGIGNSATTDYTTLFDDLPGETIGYYISTITTPGTQTVPQTWESGSGNRYLNMSIKDAAATGMIASFTVTVMGN